MEAPEHLDPALESPDELAAYLVRRFSLERQKAEAAVGFRQYFGFREEPFALAPDPRCLYLGRTHQQALTALEQGLSSNHGFTAVIAPPGIGKTTLLLRFLENIRQTARTVLLFNIDSKCEPQDFIAYILRNLGIAPAQSGSEIHEQFTNALATESRAGRKFVIVIDEAQTLSDALLEKVRLLSNFEQSSGKTMHVVLSGQPQLSEKLMQPSLEQLRQRISTVCHIKPLAAEEIVPYIGYRAKHAGYVGAALFTEGALELIAEASHGTPRTINNICHNALSICHAQKSKQVDSSMVAKAIAGLDLIPQSIEPIAAAANVSPQQPIEHEPLNQARQLFKDLMPATSGSVMLWVPAVALLLVAALFGILKPTEVQPVHAPAAATTSKTTATNPTLNTAPVQPGPATGHPVSAPVPASAQASVKPPTSADPSTPQQSFTPARHNGLPASAPTSAKSAQAALADDSPLMVQIATFAHPEDSDALMSALRDRGYAVTALREPADNLTHVAIGPFSSRDEASKMREKLLNDGYNAIIQP